MENYLKVIMHVSTGGGQKFDVLEDDRIRAAYIVETDPELGTCKEVAALANA
jgi:3-phosphoglycerate kinase